MSAISNFLEAELLDHVFNALAYAAGPDTYVALFTDDPGDDASGTEVSGGSYARVRVYENGGGTPDWTLAAVDGVAYSVENDDSITFPTATASWGTVTHVAIFDAATSGNLLYHGALDESKTIGTDDVFKINAGNLTCKLQ